MAITTSHFFKGFSTISLQRKLLLFVVVALSLIFTGTGLIIYKLVNDTFMESEKNHIMIISESLASKVGVWYFINKDYDHSGIEEYFKSILFSYDLEYIAFRDKNGTLLSEVKTPGYSKNDPYSLSYEKSVYSPRESGSEEILGKLEIGYGHHVLKELSDKYYAAGILLVILLSLYFYLEMRLLKELLTPLRNIASAIKGYMPGDKLIFAPFDGQREDEIGEIVNGFLHMQQNIDEAMRMREIEEENNKAKDAILLRQSRFIEMGTMISNISHQWKQPLNIVELCITDLSIKSMMGDVDTEYQQKLFNDMHLQVAFMSKTIDIFNNFLNEDAETKKRESFFIKKAAEDTLQLLRSTIDKKKIDMVLKLDADACAYGAISEMEQVLLIILNNAIDAGSSEIRLECMAGEENHFIRIHDNGGGIPSSILDHIFDAYFTTKHPSQGTGLGLFIAKTIVEMKFNGTIEAQNQENGALFTITLPLPPKENEQTA